MSSSLFLRKSDVASITSPEPDQIALFLDENGKLVSMDSNRVVTAVGTGDGMIRGITGPLSGSISLFYLGFLDVGTDYYARIILDAIAITEPNINSRCNFSTTADLQVVNGIGILTDTGYVSDNPDVSISLNSNTVKLNCSSATDIWRWCISIRILKVSF